MPLFGGGKKKEAPSKPMQPQSNLANLTNVVISLRQQGLDNNQIVQYLQRSGYGTSQIFDALNQADIGGNAGQIPSEQMAPFPQSQIQQDIPPPSGMPPPGMSPPGIPPPEMPNNEERIEELIETVIDEKWEEFSKNINRIIEWKNKTEAKITSLEQQFKDLKETFNKLHAAIIGKIGEYDQNIKNVGTEIKAMEKVFQKILPTFTDNVNELSRVTKKLKG